MTVRIVREGRRGSEAPWLSRLRTKTLKDGSQTIDSCVSNVVEILIHSDEWRGVLGYDEMAGRVVIRSKPPWTYDPAPAPRAWTDEDDIRLGVWFSTHQRWWSAVKTMTAFEGAKVAARSLPFHPVRDYLRATKWDGVPRLDAWCSTYLGVEPSDYARTVGRLWLVSAVARVMRPGCQADHVLILEGDQGAGKSQVLKMLFGGSPWFSDSPIGIGTKDGMQALRGRWCIELAELDSLIRADRDTAKAYFSSSVDSYRPSHGRVEVEVPRQCVFVGSVNPGASGYLDDETGARRYWPVRTGVLDVAAVARDRDQLWAEAVAEFDDGRPWWPDPTLRAPIEAEQSDRYREDAWREPIEEWIRSADGQRRLTDHGGWTSGDILGRALGIETGHWRRPEETRCGRVMVRLGYQARKVRDADGNRTRRYVPSE